MRARLRKWRKAKARIWGRGSNYIRFTPDVGFSLGLPWKSKRGFKQRIRFANHHGVQIVEWRSSRWVVTKQLLGKSKVIGGTHLMHLSKTRR